jgi:hypothetical protein
MKWPPNDSTFRIARSNIEIQYAAHQQSNDPDSNSTTSILMASSKKGSVDDNLVRSQPHS